MRLLYLEDEKTGTNYFVEDLSDYGVETEWFTSPKEAFQKLELERNFDAILLDVMLPNDLDDLDDTSYGLNTGIEFAKYLKKMNYSVPIVIFSGKARIEEALLNKEIVSSVIQKPPRSVESLIEKIKQAIEKNSNDF